MHTHIYIYTHTHTTYTYNLYAYTCTLYIYIYIYIYIFITQTLTLFISNTHFFFFNPGTTMKQFLTHNTKIHILFCHWSFFFFLRFVLFNYPEIFTVFTVVIRNWLTWSDGVVVHMQMVTIAHSPVAACGLGRCRRQFSVRKHSHQEYWECQQQTQLNWNGTKQSRENHSFARDVW